MARGLMPNHPMRTRLPYVLRVLHARPRLLISAALGVVLILLLPAAIPWARRLLAGWNAGVLLYLLLLYRRFAGASASDIRSHAAAEDEGSVVILALTVAAALASIGAIVAELGTGEGVARTAVQLALATVTIVLSWALIHTIFALHYAHEFYGSGKDSGGLRFPTERPPDYLGFVYFSFGIGTATQVSDVSIVSRDIRRIVTAHSIVSFFFNVALLALVVNIAASAI
jgi:uncharacterized membrane protein